jgi:hypothetical protein
MTRNREKEHLQQSYIDFGNIPGKYICILSLIYNRNICPHKLIIGDIIWGVNIKHNSYPQKSILNDEAKGSILSVNVNTNLWNVGFAQNIEVIKELAMLS